jgi:DNA-binding LytR/AlgR family response regulator
MAVDDEPLALELLEDNIRKLPFLKLEASCCNAIEAMKLLQASPIAIDLIFLDIQMPGLTGLQFIQSLQNKPMIILVTAYEKFALEGFNLDVVDYLVKPVSLDRFVKACNKAWELFQLKKSVVHAVGASTGTGSSQEFMFVNVDYSLLKVNFSDITYIEGLKDYIKIHLKTAPGKPIITRMSMKSLEEQLPVQKFIRIHKSYFISVDQITAIKKSSVFVGAMELPVGESYKEAVTQITGRNA